MTERPAGAAPLEVTLANPGADRVKRVRALAGRSVRLRQGLFLAEGPGAVSAAVTRAADRVRDVYVGESAAARHPQLVADALAAGLYVHGTTDEVAESMSADAQGVIAVLEQWRDGLDAIPAGARLVAVLVDVRDPGNVGTIIRAADAAGADAVVLAENCADPLSPKVVRASAGSVFHLPVIRDVSLADAAGALRERGVTLLATSLGGAATLGDDAGPGSLAALAEPTAWVLGNEASGLSHEQVALADHAVRIPVLGSAESLNVAVAAAVCLYASAIFAPADGRTAPK